MLKHVKTTKIMKFTIQLSCDKIKQFKTTLKQWNDHIHIAIKLRMNDCKLEIQPAVLNLYKLNISKDTMSNVFYISA